MTATKAYLGNNLKVREVLGIVNRVEDAVRLMDQKIKELEMAKHVLLNLSADQPEAASNNTKPVKLTNRIAILQVLSDVGKAITANSIVSGLQGKGKYTTLTTVRSDLSKAKRDGLATNAKGKWKITPEGEKLVTPAMRAGIASKPWTVEYLLGKAGLD